jgi:hypothetical protein
MCFAAHWKRITPWFVQAPIAACIGATLCVLCLRVAASPTNSIARVWDEAILSGIRIDVPNLPVHARNLYHLSITMYDTWGAYDPVAVGYLYHAKQTATDVTAARREAISYAAYRLLIERYALSKGAATTRPALDAQMIALGYETNNLSLDPTTPAGLGNTVAATVSSYFLNDGSLQTGDYQDLPATQGGYRPVNPPLLTQASVLEPDRDGEGLGVGPCVLQGLAVGGNVFPRRVFICQAKPPASVHGGSVERRTELLN